MEGLGRETFRAFVMTDVVGSTLLTQEQPAAYGRALAKHNELAERCFAEAGGKLLKSRGQGDGLLGEFPSPTQAIRGAVAFREALDGLEELPLQCRFSVHAGNCFGDGEDYFGHTLNLCARLRDVGHANQIIVSGVAAELAGSLKTEGLEFVDLGWHGLKDIAEAIPIRQVDRAGANRRFPNLKTDARFKMPTFGTPFVGRSAELERIGNALDTNRAIQLLGPGGMGKTRLAVYGAEVESRQRGVPCAFANLIEAVDSASVEQVLAGTLGHSKLSDVARSTDQGLILVIDNCEHVLSEATQAIVDLLESCPNLKIIATSRVRLIVGGCATLNLDGLEGGADGAGYDLFVTLARYQDDSFEVEAQDEEHIEEICRMADGVPLILELAAFYANHMSVPQIRTRLQELVLEGTGQGRHGSIVAALRGSIAPLSDEAKAACGDLAWLASGFTMDAATKIVGPSATRVIRELTDASLIRFDRTAQPFPRYRFLEVIRVYIRDLFSSGHAGDAFYRWALEKVETLASNLNDETARIEAGAEIGNFRVALSTEQSSPEKIGLKIATALAQYWVSTGASEGKTWLEAMLRRYPEPIEIEDELILYANAYNRMGAIAYRFQDWDAASAAYSRAKDYASRAGNTKFEVSIRLNSALVLAEQGHLELARPILVESEEFFRKQDLQGLWRLALINLARVEERSGNFAHAEELLIQFLSAEDEYGPNSLICLSALATCSLLLGKDPASLLDEIALRESTLDIHGRALYYLIRSVDAFTRGQFEKEAEYSQTCDFLITEGAVLNSFDLELKQRVMKAKVKSAR